MDLNQFRMGEGAVTHGSFDDDTDSDLEILTSPPLTNPKRGSIFKSVKKSSHFQAVEKVMSNEDRKAKLAKQGYRNTGHDGGWFSKNKSKKEIKASKRKAEKAHKDMRSKDKKPKKKKAYASPDSVVDEYDDDSEMADFIVDDDEEEGSDNSVDEEDSIGALSDPSDDSEDPNDSESPVKKSKNKKKGAMAEMKSNRAKKKKLNNSRDDTFSNSGGLMSMLPPPKEHIDITEIDFDDDAHSKQIPKADKVKGGRLYKPNYKVPINVDSDDEEDIEDAGIDVEEESEAEGGDDEEDDIEKAQRSEAKDLLKDIEKLVRQMHSKINRWSNSMVQGGALALNDTKGDADGDADWISGETISKLCPNLKLAPYQIVGVNWLAMLSRQTFRGKDVNGIIGDEMGLGKTVQTIAYLRWFKEFGGGIEEKENTSTVTARKTFFDSDDESPPPPLTYKKMLEPHLIVVPASVLDNWEREFTKFAPDLEILKYHGSVAQRCDIKHAMRSQMSIPGSKLPDIVLTTFTYFSTEKADDRSFLRKFSFNYLIVDEGHTLKNPAGSRYRNLHKFNTKHRILLTGTPVQNNPKELMALLTFLMPLFKQPKRKTWEDDDAYDGGAKMLSHFVSIKQDTDEAEGRIDEKTGYDKLKHLLAPFILRRRKDDVLSQILPPKTHIVERVKMSDATSRLYNNILRAHGEAKKDAKLNQKQCRNIFTELRKACNQPLLLRTRWTDPSSVATLVRWLRNGGYFGNDHTLHDDMIRAELAEMSDYAIHSACQSLMQEQSILVKHLARFTLVERDLFTSPKCILLRSLLPKLVSEGHRILLFSQWKMNLDILQCLLQVLDMKFHRLDGDLKVSERMEMIDSFNNDPSYKVFLLSTRAGGMGINLTSADTCIIHDCDFNPTMDQQAEDRCHRIGQKKPVTIYKLVCDDTVDEGIYDLAEKKTIANRAILSEATGEEKEKTSGESNDKKDISLLISEAFQKFYEHEKEELGGVAEAAKADVVKVKKSDFEGDDDDWEKEQEEKKEEQKPQAPPSPSKPSKHIFLDDSDTE